MMTLEEEGAYIRLVAYCWQHGTIPRDPKEAARLIGKGASTTLAANVLKMFSPARERGRLIHDRHEEIRERQEAWRQKSAEGGRKSAEMRSKGGSTVVQPPLQPKGNIPLPFPLPFPFPVQEVSDKASDKAKKLSKNERELACRMEAALNSQWVNDAGKWIGRIRSSFSKTERVCAEVESAIKETRISETPAQYAEHIWKEFA